MLDWWFPPRAEERLVRSLVATTITPTPTYPAPNTVCLLPFAHPHVTALIHEAKFYHNQRAHAVLGEVLATYITQYVPHVAILPIPLHPARERRRGFNQVTTCLRTNPSLRAQLYPQLLTRVRNTKPQTTLSATDRAENVRHAFTVRQPTRTAIDPAVPLLLVDDVYTTGATLNAARTAIRAAFPQHTIHCLAIAYA